MIKRVVFCCALFLLHACGNSDARDVTGFDFEKEGGFELVAEVDYDAFFESFINNYSDRDYKEIKKNARLLSDNPIAFFEKFKEEVKSHNYDILTCFSKANEDKFEDYSASEDLINDLIEEYKGQSRLMLEKINKSLRLENIIFNSKLGENCLITIQCKEPSDSLIVLSKIFNPSQFSINETYSIGELIPSFLEMDSTIFGIDIEGIIAKETELKRDTSLLEVDPILDTNALLLKNYGAFQGKFMINWYADYYQGINPELGYVKIADTTLIRSVISDYSTELGRNVCWSNYTLEEGEYVVLLIKKPSDDKSRFTNADFRKVETEELEFSTDINAKNLVIYFTPDGQEKFHKLTFNLVGLPVLISYGNLALSSPTINEPIDSEFITVLSYLTSEKLEKFVAQLNISAQWKSMTKKSSSFIEK